MQQTASLLPLSGISDLQSLRQSVAFSVDEKRSAALAGGPQWNDCSTNQNNCLPLRGADAALHAAGARSRGGAPGGRGWGVVKGIEERQKQIPFGNDNKKGKNKSKGKSKGKSNGNGVADG